jgi:hypothetical protein
MRYLLTLSGLILAVALVGAGCTDTQDDGRDYVPNACCYVRCVGDNFNVSHTRVGSVAECVDFGESSCYSSAPPDGEVLQCDPESDCVDCAPDWWLDERGTEG